MSTLLRSDDIVRENLSFESVELLLSQEIGPLRAYVGAERIFRREPETLPSELLHGGVELRSGRAGKVQMVGGVDVKTTEQYDWSPALSVRVGLEVGRPGPEGHPGRLIMLLLELYRGSFTVRPVFSGRHLLYRRRYPLRTVIRSVTARPSRPVP